MIDGGLVRSIERATVSAVAPREVLEMADWIVPFDSSAVGRARSAAPLTHDAGVGALDEIIDAYRHRELRPAFRIADEDGLAEVREGLAARGLAPSKPTWVMTGDAAVLAGFCPSAAVLMDRPDTAWVDVFCGEGFDPDEAASRVAQLSRSPDALYGAVRDSRGTLAVGVVSFGHGWAGVHGMRTAPAARGQGCASQILAAFGAAALARGLARVVLQVEASNPAQSLYRKAGFSAVWRYHYWA